MLVRLAGVELTPEGKEWLQKNLAPAQTVWLKLISREEDVLHCLVCHSRVRHQINETKERYCCLSVALVYFLNDRCGTLHVSPVADMAVAVNYSDHLARVRYFLQQGLAWLTQTICTNTLARLSPPILTLVHTVKTFVSQQDGVCYLALALLRNSPEKWQKELKVSSLPQNTPDPNLIDLHEMCKKKNYDPQNAVDMSGVLLSVTMSRQL